MTHATPMPTVRVCDLPANVGLVRALRLEDGTEVEVSDIEDLVLGGARAYLVSQYGIGDAVARQFVIPAHRVSVIECAPPAAD